MRKTILFLLCILLLVVVFAIALVACDNKHEHNYGDWIITKEATCLEQGLKQKVCQDCGAIFGEPIEALGHYTISESGMAPTCLSAGYTESSYCSRCGEIFVARQTIDPLGHNMHDEIVPPTCTTNGYILHTCLRCGYYYNSDVVSLLEHNYINGFCSICGKKYPIIEFGSYPQTEVTDEAITSALATLAGALPTSSDSGNWTNFEYFDIDDMWYIDVEYEEEKYRGIYFLSRRSSNNNYDFLGCVIYWFKYEPIRWRILSENNGVALILCEMIIDGQPYQSEYVRYADGCFNMSEGVPERTSANNYEYSFIRAWLNNTFYNTAFNEIERMSILVASVDNSENSTAYSPNPYACSNTEDKVFLLSYKEAISSSYELDTNKRRLKYVTDYARINGCETNMEKFSDGTIIYKGAWWWRSPYSHQYAEDYSFMVWCADNGGGYGCFNTGEINGIAPAIIINSQ